MDVLDKIYTKARLELIPVGVHFDLTYRCHQRCVHCYLPESWRRGEGPGSDLTTPQVKNILDQLADIGTFFLTFSGGEIFLRSDLVQLLEYARKLNFSISLLSSGSMGPNEDQIQFLADLKIESLIVSLFSMNSATHDRITRLSGSFRKVMHTIEKCRYKEINVTASNTILSFNYHDNSEIENFTNNMGIKFRSNSGLLPRWDQKPHRSGLDPTQIKYLQTSQDQEINLGKTSEQYAQIHRSNGLDKLCGAGSNTCYITPQGEIWPCIELPWNCGKISEKDNFSGIWENATPLKTVRQLMQKGWSLEGKLCHLVKKYDLFQFDQNKIMETLL